MLERHNGMERNVSPQAHLIQVVGNGNKHPPLHLLIGAQLDSMVYLPRCWLLCYTPLVGGQYTTSPPPVPDNVRSKLFFQTKFHGTMKAMINHERSSRLKKQSVQCVSPCQMKSLYFVPQGTLDHTTSQIMCGSMYSNPTQHVAFFFQLDKTDQ